MGLTVPAIPHSFPRSGRLRAADTVVMVIDMQGEGVEVRPLKMPTGGSEFNEVFFNDVFVPDDDVVGPVDDGWTVARATLGNESVSIGGGQGGAALPGPRAISPSWCCRRTGTRRPRSWPS